MYCVMAYDKRADMSRRAKDCLFIWRQEVMVELNNKGGDLKKLQLHRCCCIHVGASVQSDLGYVNRRTCLCTSPGYMALGAGANVRACELEAPCSSPVKVGTQQTFFHFDAYIEGPPGGLGYHV